jgi:hypothetical protein
MDTLNTEFTALFDVELMGYQLSRFQPFLAQLEYLSYKLTFHVLDRDPFSAWRAIAVKVNGESFLVVHLQSQESRDQQRCVAEILAFLQGFSYAMQLAYSNPPYVKSA